jgi:ribosomal protein S18 acetylase RimI-like enzyme
VFELTKLAVDPDVRKGGVGRALCEKVIERFQARGGTLLYLETNTLLENAIRLYKKLGFKELPNPIDSPYERSNYYMEWRG